MQARVPQGALGGPVLRTQRALLCFAKCAALWSLQEDGLWPQQWEGRKPVVRDEAQACCGEGLGVRQGGVGAGLVGMAVVGGQLVAPVFQCLKVAGNIVCLLLVLGCWRGFFRSLLDLHGCC